MIPWLLPALGFGIGLWLLLLGAMPARTSLAEGMARLPLAYHASLARPSTWHSYAPPCACSAASGRRRAGRDEAHRQERSFQP